jgi:hypothetical protein
MLPPQDRMTRPMPADVPALAKGRMMYTRYNPHISAPSPFLLPAYE